MLSYPKRLHPERHTDAFFPPPHFSSKEQLEKRREELRFNLRMAAGLYPWPEKTPLHPKFEEVGVFDGYSVKKVMYESYPGLWSTGNLYLPHPLPKTAPAIFNVIGHWEQQRLTRMETADYPRQLANFARMGFVCLVTDMIGMVDHRQLSHSYGKGEKQLWCSNGLGVQLWNNIRGLDLLCSLPYVDANRIGMTGASGGGSQTLFLTLLDDRIRAAAPINMISSHMQGGCQCENAPGLRQDTDNVEMCAMIAPRPLFLAGSTGDWTKNLLTDELPAMQAAYQLYDAEHLVEHFYQDAGHQYNEKTRHRVYRFFARHLMGSELSWIEQPLEVENLHSLTWFSGKQKADGFADDEAFFAYHRTERTNAAAVLSVKEKRKMLRWMIAAASTESGMLLQQIQWIHPENWDGKQLCLVLEDTNAGRIPVREQESLLSKNVAIGFGSLYMSTGRFDEQSIGYAQDDPYYTTFHPTVDACRVQDALALFTAAKKMCETVSVWASGSSARATACALALTEAVSSAKLERNALDLQTDREYEQKFYIPGIRILGGLQGCLDMSNGKIELF